MIPFHQHDLTSFSVDKVAEVLSSQFITSSTVCAYVENQLKEYFSVQHAFLTNSWTNGGIAALLSLDIKPGDEVIVPAMSFLTHSLWIIIKLKMRLHLRQDVLFLYIFMD